MIRYILHTVLYMIITFQLFLQWQRRSNLTGVTFSTTNFEDRPYAVSFFFNLTNLYYIFGKYLHETSNGGVTFTGMFPTIFNILRDQMNFTYTESLPPDLQFGALVSS